MDTNLILPIEGHQLANFIYSLLGQRRTIEKTFRVRSLSVTHDQLIDLVELINQRVAQNASELVTTKCSIYFKSGRAITLFDQQSFTAFNDLSKELTIGADLRLTYLVRFSGADKPEKQDIRIELFSNSLPRNFPGLVRSREEPLLKFTVETTNLTWGEDISHHLNTALSHLLVEDLFSRIGYFVWKYTEGPFAVLFATAGLMMFTAGWIASGKLVHNSGLLETRLKDLTNDTGISLINKKLDILLMREYPEPLSAIIFRLAHSPRTYGLLASLALVVFSIWLIRHFGQIRFVACNRYTAGELEAHASTRDNIRWAVMAALFVGVLAGVLATRLDTLLFGTSFF